jgi:hypothetical protein
VLLVYGLGTIVGSSLAARARPQACSHGDNVRVVATA